MTSGFDVRSAVPNDGAHLALLADAATRRLNAWLWNDAARAGQSSFEVGRDSIRTDPNSLYYFERWQVFERAGDVAGGLNGYLLGPTSNVASPDLAAVLEPIVELKNVAEGSWYISVAAVFPEFRGKGLGRHILTTAEATARAAGIDKLTLIVADFNPGALRVYERYGFTEWDRRPFVTFPGSDPGGNWLLLGCDLDG